MNIDTATLAIFINAVVMLGLCFELILMVLFLKKSIPIIIKLIKENDNKHASGYREKVPQYIEDNALNTMVYGNDVYITEDCNIRYQQIIKPEKANVLTFFDKAKADCIEFRSKSIELHEFNKVWQFLRDLSFTEITSKMCIGGLNIMLRIEFRNGLDIVMVVGIMKESEILIATDKVELDSTKRDKIENHFRFMEIVKINSKTSKYVLYNHTREEFLT